MNDESTKILLSKPIKNNKNKNLATSLIPDGKYEQTGSIVLVDAIVHSNVSAVVSLNIK